MRTERYESKLQTLQTTSASAATPAGPEFQVLWWDAAKAALISACVPTPAVSLLGCYEQICLTFPLPASGISKTSGLELNACGGVVFNCLTSSSFCYPQKCQAKHSLFGLQSAYCHVDHASSYHHTQHGNNSAINSGGIIHHNCAQMTFRSCPSTLEGELVYYSPICYSELRARSALVFRNSYLKMCKKFQALWYIY